MQICDTSKIGITSYLFHREAGLQCALVEGVAKPFELKPQQDTIDVIPDIWTCVHVEGEWQIVHPHLICKVK